MALSFLILVTMVISCLSNRIPEHSRDIDISDEYPNFSISGYLGIFDEGYNSIINNNDIPWHIFDRINIAFSTIDQYGNLTDLSPDSEEKIQNITRLYRKYQPDGKILVSSNYDGVMDSRYLLAAKSARNFAQSVVNYLKRYNLDGYDMDWETYYINDDTIYKESYITLLSACNELFGEKYLLTTAIMPGVPSLDLIGNLSQIVDYINIMTYYNNRFEIISIINEYNSTGLPYNKMILGINTEALQISNSISDKIEIVRKYGLHGIFNWRIDNNHSPEWWKVIS